MDERARPAGEQVEVDLSSPTHAEGGTAISGPALFCFALPLRYRRLLAPLASLCALATVAADLEGHLVLF